MIGYSTKSIELTAKEKSLLGIGVFPAFQDLFNTVADGADPDVTNWTVVENNGVVKIENHTTDLPGGWCLAASGANTGDDGLACTFDKRIISFKEGVETIHFASRVNPLWASNTGYVVGIGLLENDSLIASIQELATANECPASIVVNDDIPTAYSSDGAVIESTDLSAHISFNTWFDLLIIISSSDVKFYIDETLRATHETRVPSSIWQIAFGGTNVDNASSETIEVEGVTLWAE